MDFWDVVLWVAGVGAGSGLAAAGINALVAWAKSTKWVKSLHIEALIDQLAAGAVHLAESWGRANAKAGFDKLNKATDELEAALEKYGIKMDIGDVEKRVEAILNRIRSEVEDEETHDRKFEEINARAKAKRLEAADGSSD